MLNVKVTGLLCISMLPVASSCNLFIVIVNFYANIKKMMIRPVSDAGMFETGKLLVS